MSEWMKKMACPLGHGKIERFYVIYVGTYRDRISWFYTCSFILNTFLGRGNLYGCGYKNTVFNLV